MAWDRNWGCRVEVDSEIRGWRATVLQNRFLRVTILNGRGCDVVEMLYKPLDIDITPRTRRGLRSRDSVSATPWSEDGSFYNNYEGGWQEIAPYGGPPGVFRGALFPQHGESTQLPWQVQIVEDNPERIEIVASVRLSIIPFQMKKRFSLTESSASLEMVTELTNESGVELPVMWGHHLVFGAPAFGPGSTIQMPSGTTYFAHVNDKVFENGRRSNGESGEWPLMSSFESTPIDMGVLPEINSPTDLHYLEPTEGHFSISSADNRVRASVDWDLSVQPYLWFWQQFGAWKDYPWWGTEYLVGIEPWTSAPGTGLGDDYVVKNSPKLGPGEMKTTSSVVTIEEENE